MLLELHIRRRRRRRKRRIKFAGILSPEFPAWEGEREALPQT